MLKVVGAPALRNCVQIVRRKTRSSLQDVVYRHEASSAAFNKVYPRHDVFSERHIGPSNAEKESMLAFLGMQVGLFLARVDHILEDVTTTSFCALKKRSWNDGKCQFVTSKKNKIEVNVKMKMTCRFGVSEPLAGFTMPWRMGLIKQFSIALYWP